MKILFVINPIAGGIDRSERIDEMKSTVSSAGFEPKVLFTSGEKDDKQIRQAVDSFKPDRVIAGGGDGTIRMVAENLIDSGISMGILPLGSANGLATALGIPSDPMVALENILKATHIKNMDMLYFNKKKRCIHVADIGVNALIVKKYEEAGTRGMIGYASHLIAAIQETPQLNITIHTGDETIHKEGYMMAFANAHKYGTGVQISDGSVSDGKFEICNVERLALDSAIKAGLTILNVFVDKDMFSDVISCKEAEIEVDKKTHFHIDGEYMGMVDRLSIEVLPGSVKLLV